MGTAARHDIPQIGRRRFALRSQQSARIQAPCRSDSGTPRRYVSHTRRKGD